MIRQLATDFFKRLIKWFRSSRFLYGSLGGLIFLAIFYYHYGDLESAAYKYRDDGVITMSHARNLVDFGHIGVDPSGKRIEGFSAPVQFWVYTAVYAVTGMEWDTFADAQTLLCTFFLGFIFLQFFEKRWIMGLISGAFAAWFMQLHHSFFQWHASGMENPWTHILFLGSALLFFRAYRGDEIKLRWALILFLASVSRLDSIYHLAPIAFSWALMWRIEYRSWKSFHLIGFAFALWGLYQFWRWTYFGSLVPHTGLAQGIDVRENLSALWHGEPNHLSESLEWARMILQNHGVWFLLPLLFLLPFTKIDRFSQFFLVMTGVMTTTVFLNPAIFGMTRLDPGRSTTMLVPFIALLLAWQLGKLQLFKRKYFFLLLLVPVMLFALRSFAPVWIGAPRPLCCEARINEEIIREGQKFAQENNLHRLNIAAPDLGKLSYSKLFNFTDLGYLGSPLMAHYRDQNELQIEYFFHYALPDMVEVHGPWCDTYKELLSDPRFRHYYAPIRESRDIPDHIKANWPEVHEGIYFRKALLKKYRTEEWKLIQDLQREPKVQKLIDAKFEALHSTPSIDPAFVMRTAYRFLPELEAVGEDNDNLFSLFDGDSREAYYKAIVKSGEWRHWEKAAIVHLESALPDLRDFWKANQQNFISSPPDHKTIYK